ncbi:hypothetical protein PIB30_052939 [Stylosanthes scabra]|uniref:Uncharacterized protein n=1 Tax=Stylosanthes scabra TaxID=79078 RepID=A0ABU6XIW5_9FABA|nr:hypothetical protein [Stylosanthes scabra]
MAVRPHDGCGASAPSPFELSDQLRKVRVPAPFGPRVRASPLRRVMARPRDSPCTLKPNAPFLTLIFTMDKKRKAKCLVSKMYASQAAARSEATSKPPTAPKAPEEPKKKPIFIDLTADSEPEDITRASSETHFSSVASCSEGHSAPR